MAEYSIRANWQEENKWNFTGREVMLEKKGEYSEDNQDGLSEDSEFPMMNYAYPLWGRPSDEEIVAVCEQTNCTVVEDDESGEFYLALTGGGMDLSQDIALAYVLCDTRIPAALAFEVSKQYGLSKSGKNWYLVAEKVMASLSVERDCAIRSIAEWEAAIKEGKKKERSDKRRYAKIAKEKKAKEKK